MIRTDDDFQPTTWAVQSDDHWPPRRPFVPQGCDQQGRLTPTIEPAHAASEYDDAEPPRTAREALAMAQTLKRVFYGLALVAAVIVGVHFGVRW